MSKHEKGSHSAAFSVSSGVAAAPLPGLAASAASRLPRWAFIALVVLYIGQGLFHRDPWRGDDVLGLALARSSIEALLSGQFSTLLLPQISGLAWNDGGPLWPLLLGLFMLPVYLWAGLSGSPLPVHLIDDFARAGIFFTVLLGLFGIWKAADRLARRREAQPIDPLGVGPGSADFGKTLGDCALLITIACLGVIYPWHQSGPESVSFMLQSLALWSLASAPERPRRSSLQIGIIIPAMLLTQGPGLALAWVFGLAAIFGLISAYRMVAQEFFARAVFLGTAVIGVWMGLVIMTQSAMSLGVWWQQQLTDWSILRLIRLDESGLDEVARWFKEMLWRWWPLWPIAFFGLWKNRAISFRRAPHWGMPLVLWLTITLFGLLGPSSWKLHHFAPIAPLALIAAFSLLALPRALVNLIDWFAISLFTALGIFIWLYWSALSFGFPAGLEARLPAAVRDLTGAPNLYDVVIGVLVSLAWISLVVWRIRRGKPALWRPVVLSAGGLTLVWVLLMTLWLPAIDRLQGQGLNAQSLNQHWRILTQHQSDRTITPTNTCVYISPKSRALHLFAVTYTNLPVNVTNEACHWRLISVESAVSYQLVEPEQKGIGREWSIVWRSQAPTNRGLRERFVLLERVSP